MKKTLTRFNNNMMLYNQQAGGVSNGMQTRLTHNKLIVQSSSNKEGKTSPELTNNFERMQQRLKLNNSHMAPSADRQSKLSTHGQQPNRVSVRSFVANTTEINGFDDHFVPPRVGKSLALSIRQAKSGPRAQQHKLHQDDQNKI